MQRHYGGVRGTVHLRGRCPHCRRDLAGGRMDRPSARVMRISLRPHNRPGTTTRCEGSGALVPADYDLTARWGAALRDRRARR